MHISFLRTFNPNAFDVAVRPQPAAREVRVGHVSRIGCTWRNNYTYRTHRSRRAATAELLELALPR